MPEPTSTPCIRNPQPPALSQLRVGQDYDERMNAKLYAKEKGMFIEEGLLAGVGESEEDIADSLFDHG